MLAKCDHDEVSSSVTDKRINFLWMPKRCWMGRSSAYETASHRTTSYLTYLCVLGKMSANEGKLFNNSLKNDPIS